MRSCMFLSIFDASLRRSAYFSFACQRGPSRVQSTSYPPPPVWFLTILAWLDSAHYFFTRCISTTWIFASAGFSAVSDPDIHLRDPLRYWGFFFPISPTFSGGVLKWSAIFLSFLRELACLCECTENVSKEKYVCTIFAVLISFYVSSRLNGFYDHRIYEYTGNFFQKENSS